jgi:hypothetical protein
VGTGDSDVHPVVSELMLETALDGHIVVDPVDSCGLEGCGHPRHGKTVPGEEGPGAVAGCDAGDRSRNPVTGHGAVDNRIHRLGSCPEESEEIGGRQFSQRRRD